MKTLDELIEENKKLLEEIHSLQEVVSELEVERICLIQEIKSFNKNNDAFDFH